jgi:hypothetical protein
MPVQRLPRYVLLLQDLVKHTPAVRGREEKRREEKRREEKRRARNKLSLAQEHPDAGDLQSAFKAMQALTQDLNAKKK